MDDINIVKESFIRNVREYRKDNVIFTSSPIKKGNNYSGLVVGTPVDPYTARPRLLLKLPDGTVVNTADIDVQVLKEKASANTDAAGMVVYNRDTKKYDKWLEGTRRLQICSWVFIIRYDRLISLSVYYRQDKEWKWSGEIPAIGNPSEGKLYQFPLKQGDVLKVFGKPDKIREYLAE